MAFSSAPYDNQIDQAALANGLNPDYFRGVLARESGFDPNAVNRSSGAQGLGQVLPSTAAQPGYGVAPLTDPFDPTANINFSASYLAARIRAAGGSLNAGTTGYSGSEYGSAGITPIPRADGQQTASLPDNSSQAVPTATGSGTALPVSSTSGELGPVTPDMMQRNGGASVLPQLTQGDWPRRISLGILGLIMITVGLVAVSRPELIGVK